MVDSLPSADEIRASLTPLTLRQIDVLAELSGVPATTIYKIKRGETTNPGIETVRKFSPHIQAALATAEQVGCDLVQRDSRAAEIAELRQRLQQLERAA